MDQSFQFREARTRLSEKGSNLHGFFNFFKSMFGAGILTMANSFSRVGLQLGLITFALCTIVVSITMYMLLDCRTHASALACREMRSYEDVAGFILGRRGKILVQYSVGVLQLLFCTGFLIVFCENMHSVFPDTKEHLIVWFVLPVLVFLSWIPNLKDMWVISALGLVVYLFGVILFSVYDGLIDYHPPEDMYDWKYEDIPHFFGVATYAMEGICLVVPTVLSLHHTEDAPPVIFGSLFMYAAVTVAYASFAFAAGLGSCDIITDCLKKGYLTTIVRLTLSAALLLTHPVYIVVPAKIIEDQFFYSFKYYSIEQVDEKIGRPRSASDNEDDCCSALFDFTSTSLKSKAVRAVLVTITCGIAASGVSFSTFSGLVGAVMTTAVGFIIPSIMWWRLYFVVGSPPVPTSAVVESAPPAAEHSFAAPPREGQRSAPVSIPSESSARGIQEARVVAVSPPKQQQQHGRATISQSQDTVGNSSLFTLLSAEESGPSDSKNGGVFSASAVGAMDDFNRSWVYSSFVAGEPGSRPYDVTLTPAPLLSLKSNSFNQPSSRQRQNSSGHSASDLKDATQHANTDDNTGTAGSLSNHRWFNRIFSWGGSAGQQDSFRRDVNAAARSANRSEQRRVDLSARSGSGSSDEDFFRLNDALISGDALVSADESRGRRESLFDYQEEVKARVYPGRLYKLPMFSWKGYAIVIFTLTAGFVAMVTGAYTGVKSLI
jgi:amino acid permease